MFYEREVFSGGGGTFGPLVQKFRIWADMKSNEHNITRNLFYEKKEEIWLSPMTNAPTLTEKSKKQRDNIKHATKNFDYTTIVDRLRTVNWSYSSYPTGVVQPVYER